MALTAWSPGDSETVLDRARQQLAASTVQNVGSAMRALVTFAFKNRWIPREADPMWLVCYSPSAEFQGQAVDYDPQRVIRVHRAVEQSRHGLAIKGTKNRQRRVTTFPASLVEPLEGWSSRVELERGPEGLLFPDANGAFANRRWFQRVWARAARDAGWPMKRKTAAVWHPHDLRHVAACWMLFDVGLDPAVVATLLGHANAAFTLSRYVGVRGDLSATVTAATEDW